MQVSAEDITATFNILALVSSVEARTALNDEAALGEHGLVVHTCYEEDAAKAFLQCESVDVLLVEPSPADKRGLDVVDRLTTIQPGTPIIIITHPARVEEALTGISRGANDFILLPARGPDFLAARIRATLERRKKELMRINEHVTDTKDQFQGMAEQFMQAHKMQAVGRLAGGVAHDFNNLLTSILGFSHIIMEEVDKESCIHEFASEIMHSGERAAALTQQLLDFSRKKVGRTEKIDLALIVKDMQELFSRTLGKDIEMVAVNEATNPCIQGDVGQVEQMLLNLAMNSRDAMPEGGTFNVHIGNKRVDDLERANQPLVLPGDYVVLEVSDSGTGIAEDVKDKVFEPFFSTKKTAKSNGLGLSIVYGVVERHKGYIEIKSTNKGGTSFQICFPCDKPAGNPNKSTYGSGLPRGNETILLVEDEPSVRGLIAHYLDSLGYRVIEAGNGGEAILAMEQYRDAIDLVLTDIVMPRMNGVKVVERLREIKKDFKVIYVSGLAIDSLPEGDVDVSNNLIQKPFSRARLASSLRHILDG